MWKVEVGKNKGSYKPRYIVATEASAYHWYYGLNVHSGYKKRLVDPNGKVIVREIT
jgi:hypothetical protein